MPLNGDEEKKKAVSTEQKRGAPSFPLGIQVFCLALRGSCDDTHSLSLSLFSRTVLLTALLCCSDCLQLCLLSSYSIHCSVKNNHPRRRSRPELSQRHNQRTVIGTVPDPHFEINPYSGRSPHHWHREYSAPEHTLNLLSTNINNYRTSISESVHDQTALAVAIRHG